MISSLKERAPRLGSLAPSHQVIQQREHKKIEHATKLTYCQVITYTKSSIVFQIDTVLQLWCQSIQPILTAGILYIRTVLNPTIQKVPKPHFVTKCTFEYAFQGTLCELLTTASLLSGQRLHIQKFKILVTHYKHCVYKILLGVSFAIFMAMSISLRPCWGFVKGICHIAMSGPC